MAKDIEVKVSDKKLKELLKALKGSSRDMGRLMFRSIDRTTKQSRTQIVNKITEKVALKKKDARNAIKYTKPSYTHWVALLDIFNNRIPLIKFGARQTKKAVSYRISKDGGREKIPKAFIAILKTGHKGVFKRVGDGDDLVGRLPITEKKGVSVGHLFENAGDIAKQVLKSTNERLAINIDKQLALMMEKMKKAA
jgi:hypothetical protein